MDNFFKYYSTAEENEGSSFFIESPRIDSDHIRGTPLPSGTYLVDGDNLTLIEKIEGEN